MKVLFYCGYPLSWAKGGHTTQILETKNNLEKLGVEIKWLHHEDLLPADADIIHYWTLPPNDLHWQLAQQRGMKIVISTLHGKQVLRPKTTWLFRGLSRKIIKYLFKNGLYYLSSLNVYTACDGVILVTPYESEYVIKVLGANKNNVYVVPNGVNDVFFNSDIKPIYFDGIVCIGNIYAHKNSVEIAKAAKNSRVPIKFIGGPISKNNTYFNQFINEVDNKYVFWEGEVNEAEKVASLIKGSKGLLLASKSEGSPLVVLEALSLKKPVMVSNLPNLRAYYNNNVSYCAMPSKSKFIKDIINFYEHPKKPKLEDFPILRWKEVAIQIKDIYNNILKKQKFCIG